MKTLILGVVSPPYADKVEVLYVPRTFSYYISIYNLLFPPEILFSCKGSSCFKPYFLYSSFVFSC